MGKFLLDIPDDLHKGLKHLSIDIEKDMGDIIVDAIKKEIKKRLNNGDNKRR